MLTKTPRNSWTDLQISSEEQVNAVNKNVKNMADQVDSLVEISVSSNPSMSPKVADYEEIRRIVRKTLDQMKDVCQLDDVEAVMDLVVPKVLYDLQLFDHLQDEVQMIKLSLDAYIQHSRVLGEDIAEIFLDLHNIYARLDKLDKLKAKQPRCKKFAQRLCEAETLIRNAKHYISQDLPVRTSSQPVLAVSCGSLTDDMTHSETVQAERKAFLTNMLMVKKSDFSMELNRTKNYYTDAERALKKRRNKRCSQSET